MWISHNQIPSLSLKSNYFFCYSSFSWNYISHKIEKLYIYSHKIISNSHRCSTWTPNTTMQNDLSWPFPTPQLHKVCFYNINIKETPIKCYIMIHYTWSKSFWFPFLAGIMPGVGCCIVIVRKIMPQKLPWIHCNPIL